MTKEQITDDIRAITGAEGDEPWFAELVDYIDNIANPPTLGISVDETVKADAKFGG